MCLEYKREYVEISVFDITCFILAKFSVVHGVLNVPLFLSYFVF